jgi:hypothetical protein
MGNGGSYTPELLAIARDAAEDFICVTSYDEADPAFQSLRLKVEARGEKFTGQLVDPYESFYLMRDVVEKVGIKGAEASLKEDRRKIRDTLAQWKNWRSPVSGHVWGFNPERESGKDGVSIIIKGGKGVKWQ